MGCRLCLVWYVLRVVSSLVSKTALDMMPDKYARIMGLEVFESCPIIQRQSRTS